MYKRQFPEDYALVLQQLKEEGSDDFESLAETLRLERSRLGHVLQALQHKGLIRVNRSWSQGPVLSLSSKGSRLEHFNRTGR